MYVEPFPYLAWLAAISGCGSIVIGAMLMMAATEESRSPNGNPHRVRSDGVMGVRLILAGVLILLAYAVWRLWA